MRTYVFGNNEDGQLGVPCLQDIEKCPLLNGRLDDTVVKHCSMSLHQSSIITEEGILLTCGANDQNLLGRSGKRSAFSRVDALETFRVRDVCYGVGFCVVVLTDGRIMSWGRNDFGQLGNGTREYKEKLRFTAGLPHRIIQVSAGSEHVVALTREGNVIAWGGNRKGQLGDGLFTSCCEAKIILQLRHRPVIQIACGEEHSLALTVGGNVYSWGSNSHGQLGLGDFKNRLRPEVIRTLKAVKVVKVAAGGKHSLAISESSRVCGLLFTFGSNSCGQLGQLDYRVNSGSEEGERMFPIPTFCDRLPEKYSVVDGQCGSAHTLLVCKEKYLDGPLKSHHCLKLFSMGLNSMGQCGLGHCQNVSRPTQVQLNSSDESSVFTNGEYSDDFKYINVYSGPLANHSIVCQSPFPLPGRLSIPSVNMHTLGEAVESYLLKRDGSSLSILREMIADSYSSIAVLNSSFRYDSSDTVTSKVSSDIGALGSVGGGVVGAAIGLDLFKVRHAYSMLFRTGNDQVVSTLGRATLAVSDKLKECPFDDSENLSVFLIVLENPLLLRPESFHLALQSIVSGILAIPQSYRVMFFGWMKKFPSEYFSHVVFVMQTYLTFVLTDRLTKLDPTPVVLVLESLYMCNAEASIIPSRLFYNSTIPKSINLAEEWKRFLECDSSKVFNFFSYPYLIPVEAKYNVIRLEFESKMKSQALIHSSLYIQRDRSDNSERIISHLPRGVIPTILPAVHDEEPRIISVKLELHVERDRVLDSLSEVLQGVICDDPKSLLLPISGRFQGETDAVDEGGVTRELFNLAIREFITTRSCLGVSGVGNKLFFTRTSSSNDRNSHDFTEEYMLGVIAGLAAYHGVLVNLPLISIVYKLFNNEQPTLDDLWSADPELARSISLIADYSGDDNLVDLFGVDFTVSPNPLLLAHVDHSTSNEDSSASYEYVCLKPNGDDIYVDRTNRKEFTDLYVQYALYHCCREAIDDYLRGLKTVLGNSRTLLLCNSEEMEYIICGSSEIGDICELRKYTTYMGEFSDHHPIIVSFWAVLAELSIYQQRRFLFFVTATDRIPVGGLSMIRMSIQPTYQEANALPAAHTCFNILDLPVSYTSQANLKDRLLTALAHSQGFGLA